jgi:hypothetical protein
LASVALWQSVVVPALILVARLPYLVVWGRRLAVTSTF